MAASYQYNLTEDDPENEDEYEADEEDEEEEEVEQECCRFGFQYVNRLMLLAVSATSLMAWDSFFNAIMPPGSANKWKLWHLILFTLCMFLLLVIMAFYYTRHQKKLSAAAKEPLSDDLKEDCDDEAAALIEQSYGNLTNAMGYITIQVWLNVYPIPDDFKYWFVLLIFLIVVFVVFLSEVVYRFIPNGSCKDVYSNINSNIVTQGVWVVVNLLVPMWRRWGNAEGWQPVDLGVPGAHQGPELRVAGACFVVSIIYIFVANLLASVCCGIKKAVNDDTDPLGAAMCDRTRGMINSACMYTTGTLLMQHFNQRSDWATNVWWWAQVCFFGSGVAVLLCQTVLSHVPCPGGCKDATMLKSESLTLLTGLLGWVTGQFYTGWIEAGLKVTQWYWIPIAVVFQIMSLCFEEVRATCLVKMATESVESIKLSAS